MSTGSGGRKISRRHVIGTAIVGGGAIAAGIYLKSCKVHPTTGAGPVEYGNEKAKEFDFNPGRIVRFVREEVSSEKYPGVLRGALGTLWSGAGNDIDRTLLLAALLDRARVEHRMVWGK